MVYIICRLFPAGHTVGFDVAPDWTVARLTNHLSQLFPAVAVTKVLFGGRVLDPRFPLEFYRLEKECSLQCVTVSASAQQGGSAQQPVRPNKFVADDEPVEDERSDQRALAPRVDLPAPAVVAPALECPHAVLVTLHSCLAVKPLPGASGRLFVFPLAHSSTWRGDLHVCASRVVCSVCVFSLAWNGVDRV